MKTSNQSLDALRTRIDAVRRLRLAVRLRAGLMRWGAGVVGLIAAFAVAEMIWDMSSAVRTLLALTYFAALAGTFAWLVAPPLLRRWGYLPGEKDAAIARLIGSHFPAIRDRLLNTLQLEQELSAAFPNYSGELITAAFNDVAAGTAGYEFTEAVDFSRANHARMEITVALVVSVILWVLLPNAFEEALYRLVHVRTEFIPPPAYLFTVTPGNTEVVKGEPVTITVRAENRTMSVLPARQELTLLYRTTQQENFDELRLRTDSSGAFTTTLPALRVTTHYLAQMAGVQSEQYTLSVVDRPVIRSLRLRVDHPPYTRILPRTLDEFVGDVTALAGSRITISGTASKDISGGTISFSGGRSVPLRGNGESFAGSFALTTDDVYRIVLRDGQRLENADPIRYRLTVVPDVPPIITLTEPGRNIDIAGDQSIRLQMEAKDDFGFTSLRLGHRLIKSRYESAAETYSYVSVPLPPNSGSEVNIKFSWNLEPMNLVPEDVVEYFAEIFDNDAIAGPKSGRTPLFLLRLPSLQEVFSDADKTHEQTIESMEKSLEAANKLKQELEQINQDLKKNKDFDWQKQKQAEEMVKKYQNIQKELQNVQQKLDDMTRQMDQQNVLSKETLEKYMELQQLMEQINSSDLQQMLKQLERSMQNADKQQMQQAMQQMQFSEDRFRQSIDRTIDLLKRLQIEQKVDEVRKRAEELKKLQDQLREDAAKAGDDPQRQKDLAARQEDLAKKLDEMRKESDALQKKMEEFFTEMPADKLQKMNQDLTSQKMDQQMQKASQQMRQGQMQAAQQNQQQVGQQLQQFAEQMDALQMEMLQKQAQHVLNELRRATINLLELSRREESLKQQSAAAPSNSPLLRQNAQDQLRAMQDLNSVIAALSELSKRSFAVTPEMGKAIGEAMARMQTAMQSLDTRNGSLAAQEQGNSMAALNNAASKVQSAMQAMMQGGQGAGAGSLMQQLQRMSALQMSLNGQTQQMGQGGKSMQQAAEAARLAQEQAAIQKSLEQLNREAQSAGDRKSMLGDLDRIAQEMKEVVKNLEQNNLSPETIQRQERILSRLLDASRSMHERDYEKRRKAETGTGVVRRGPGELDPNALNATSKLRQDLLKALDQRYSKDYEELIRRYFEDLERTQVEK